MNASTCSEFDKLRSEVDATLHHLIELTTLLRQVFRDGDYKYLVDTIRSWKNAVGQKERAIGATRQHALEHKCQPAGFDFSKQSDQ